jgi:alpha-beta hydrolase superfamily lysophospholipase
MQIFANGLRLEVEDTGERDRPAVLLIAGMSMQLIVWPDDMVHQLHQAGFRVVRFDNRDIGLSQSMDEAPTPNLLWFMFQQKLGLKPQTAYSMQDMAQRCFSRLLDHLQIKQAHLVGVSMGGMIGQRICLTAPERVLKPDQHHEQQWCQRLARSHIRAMRRVLFTPPAGPVHRGCTSTCFAFCSSPGRTRLCSSLKDRKNKLVRRVDETQLKTHGGIPTNVGGAMADRDARCNAGSTSMHPHFGDAWQS